MGRMNLEAMWADDSAWTARPLFAIPLLGLQEEVGKSRSEILEIKKNTKIHHICLFENDNSQWWDTRGPPCNHLHEDNQGASSRSNLHQT